MRLINADALKRAIKTECNPYGKPTIDFESGKKVLKIIDNVPTIEERRKGKWIAREDMNFLDENKVWHFHFMCEKCGLIHDFIDGHTSQYNFCPNCGARMIKEEQNADT